jgi:hypothetical protein
VARQAGEWDVNFFGHVTVGQKRKLQISDCGFQIETEVYEHEAIISKSTSRYCALQAGVRIAKSKI